MKKKYKKLIYLAGFASASYLSMFTIKQSKYAKNVDNHAYIEENHDGTVIAHRGFSSLEVENSLTAIDRAFKCDCTDEVEIDVRLTSDEEIVLSHDSIINGMESIAKKDLAELEDRQYSSGVISKFNALKQSLFSLDGKLKYDRYNNLKNSKERFVSLKTVLEAEDEEEKTLLIDIKFNEKTKDKMMNKLNEILINYNGKLNIILQSLDVETLLEMKEKYPDYTYQFILSNQEDLEFLKEDIDRVAFKHTLITKELVEEELKKGRIVSVWTINSYHSYKKLYEEVGEVINSISIITDYPDEICYLRNSNKIKTKK